ncbi:MAG: glycosyltransferase [Bacteroidales bacterium]|jgi:glycosyltransferase involved in cell wall biosynthesis|nr:glycosyltransferase [Bacteroidales bacterium]
MNDIQQPIQISVSVIIPIYNARVWIVKCCEGLFSQTLRDMEIIFVDDCSQDGSFEILQDEIKRVQEIKKNNGETMPEVVLIQNEKNKGVALSRNLTLEKAKGKYVGFVDADDWITSDMYEKMYEKAIEEDSDIVWSDFYWSEEGYVRQDFPNDRMTCLEQMSLTNMYWTLWNKIFKRELFTENNLRMSDFKVASDMITFKLFYYAVKVSYLPMAFYHYNRHTQNALTTNLYKQHYKITPLVESLQEISSFFQSMPDGNSYRSIVFNLQVWFKNDFLHAVVCRQSLSIWRDLFPATHKFYRKYGKTNRLQRFFFFCAIHNITAWCVILKNRIVQRLFGKSDCK